MLMKVLLLRLDAPMMSFGGAVVDERHPTRMYPTRSFLTGLCGNALGYRWHESERLGALQSSLVHATRWDKWPTVMREYQTVDLSQPKLNATGKYGAYAGGWTTRGVPETRSGGPAVEGTHQVYLDYLVDGIATVAVALARDAQVELQSLAAALERPRRPLYFGRKTCVPAAPLVVDMVEAESVLHALVAASMASRWDVEGAIGMDAQWPAGQPPVARGRLVWVPGSSMDWKTRLHVGREERMVGRLEISK